MSVWYYGVVAEDTKHVYVVYVGRNLVLHDEELVELRKRLDDLYEFAEKSWVIREAENVTSFDSLRILLDAYKAVEEVFSYPAGLIGYLLICRAIGRDPEILGEYDLEELEEKKEVVILDELSFEEYGEVE